MTVRMGYLRKDKVNGKLLYMAVITLLLFVKIPAVCAQTEKNTVSFDVPSSLTTANAELTDITVEVHNPAATAFEGVVSIDMDRSLSLVSKQKAQISLKPGDSIYVNFKVLVSKYAKGGDKHLLYLTLKDEAGRWSIKRACSLNIHEKKSVSLWTLSSNILLQNKGDSINIPVRVLNSGNTPQKVTIIDRYPPSVQSSGFHGSKQFILKPFKDTLVYCGKRVTREMLQSEGFDVTITGLYVNGDIFGISSVRVQTARNSRYYMSPGTQQYLETYNNSFSLSTENSFTAYQSYQLTGRGDVNLPGAKLGFSVDALKWKNDYSPMILRNTFLDYETRNAGVKAGSISRNFDINLNGAGLAVYGTDTSRNNYYESGYIAETYNLLGNYSVPVENGKAYWGTFKHEGKGLNFGNTGIVELNPLQNRKNILLSNEMEWTDVKDIRFSASLGVSHAGLYDDKDSKMGLAGGFGFTGKIRDFEVSSSQYFSTAYYSGIQRGAANANERVVWMSGRTQLWGALNYYRYAPRDFAAVSAFNPVYGSLRAETGLLRNFPKNISLTVSPYYYSEHNNSYLINGNSIDAAYSAFRLAAFFNYYNDRYSQFLSLNVEDGFSYSSFDPFYHFHFKTNANYRYGIFNLNAFFQLGNFFLSETAGNYIQDISRNRTINITASVHRKVLKEGRIEAGVSYLNNSFAGNSFLLSGRLEYDISRQSSLFAGLQHNQFEYGSYDMSNFQMGITKRLRPPRIGSKNNSVELFLFKDENQNGVYDKSDSAAKNFLVYINETIFITRPDGTVTYRDVPEGVYAVVLPALKGWYAPPQNIKVDKNLKISIPLQKNAAVGGKIDYLSTEFSYEIKKETAGVMLTAVNTRGEEYTTKTDDKGQFIFYLPEGRYHILIKSDHIPPEVECLNNNQSIVVTAGSHLSVNFQLKVRERKIETKKFVSPSLKHLQK